MRIILGSDLVHYGDRPGAFDNRLAYVRGLEQLGHEVFVFTEVNPARCGAGADGGFRWESWPGVRRFAALARQHGFGSRYCVLGDRGAATDGMSLAGAVRVAESADLLINISGKVRRAEILERVACRVFVDLAPAKTQVYQQEYHLDQGLDQHQHFFTVGLNLGHPDCPVPTAGRRWHPLLHPVDLDRWPTRIGPQGAAFTSITNWAGKETFTLGGRYSGEKSDNWRRFIELPRRTDQPLAIAVNLGADHGNDAALFTAAGWRLVDPNQWTSLADYQSFIAGSRAEFSVANERYVAFRTGWFSDRSARYLAAGKPVLVQSTGIEPYLPTGSGLLTFTTIETAVAGMERINADYQRHCRAARALAEDRFDARKVLGRLLETVGA